MLNDFQRLGQLQRQGFYCSQIILIEGLEMLGKDNPDLLRAMHGLAGGLGFSGELCGALTGGVCLLGLYAGKGLPEEPPDARLNLMINELVEWFKGEYGLRYGGVRCVEILQDNPALQATRCPEMVQAVLQKSRELLVENGFDLSGIQL